MLCHKYRGQESNPDRWKSNAYTLSSLYPWRTREQGHIIWSLVQVQRWMRIDLKIACAFIYSQSSEKTLSTEDVNEVRMWVGVEGLWFPLPCLSPWKHTERSLISAAFVRWDVNENREAWNSGLDGFQYFWGQKMTHVWQVFLHESGCSGCSDTWPLVHVYKTFWIIVVIIIIIIT